MRFHLLAVAFTGILTLGVVSQSASAQIATQTVTFSVVSMSRASVSGTVSPIMVRSARANRTPTSASVGGTTYAITTNEANQKIAASLDQAMPAGVSLAVTLTAPAGAASRGTTNLGTASADVVTGISGVEATALPIVYTLSAASETSAAPRTRVVTFTITAGL
jgi:hypothetical protein